MPNYAHTYSSMDSAPSPWRNEQFAPLANLLARAVESGSMLAVASVIVATPILLNLLHPAAGIPAALLLAGACAWRLPQIAIVAIVFSFLFQNLIVSLVASYISGPDDFDLIRGYNFLILSVVWAVSVYRIIANWRSRNRALDPYLKFTVAVMAVIGVYFIVGYARTGITAIVYLRNIVTPLLLFQVCLLAFAARPVRIGSALGTIAALAVICGFFEFLARDAWLSATNGQVFWDLAGGANWMTLAYDKAVLESGLVATGLADTFKIAIFNSPLLAEYDIEVMRLFGPNMHAISFAYALSFFCIFSLYRARFGLAALLLVLMVLCNAKGPIIMFILVGGGWVAFRLFGARFSFTMICLGLLGYIGLGVIVGMDIEDYHVLGLMAGLIDFTTNPIGWGIGSGGNLSPDFATIDWSAAQGAGRAPFAVESSVAVLMHQMGIFAFAMVACYIWIAWRVMMLARLTDNDLHIATALGLMCMVANGVFQEEAYFAPLALALFLGLAGMIIGASIRSGVGIDDAAEIIS